MHKDKIKLLVADDHGILRHGLKRILNAEPDMIVVGEAATGTEAVARAKELKPDVVIMDISMPEQNGIESMRQIIKAVGSKVLILSVYVDHQVISEAVSSGASGYLAKESFDHELISAVRTVVHGGTVFSANVSRRLAESSQVVASSPRPFHGLTLREREVFLLLAEGKSPSEIAKALSVSPKTVHTHRQHIMEKLNLRTTTELIRFALRERLIPTN